MFGFIEHIPFETHEVHPQYNPVTHENDLWMIKLQWPSQLYANQVVQLETPDDNIVLTSGVNLRAMGFGRLAFDGENANVLQEVTLDYFSNADCTNPLVGGIPPDWIFPGMFCAGSTSGRGTCRVSIYIPGTCNDVVIQMLSDTVLVSHIILFLFEGRLRGAYHPYCVRKAGWHCVVFKSNLWSIQSQCVSACQCTLQLHHLHDLDVER